MSTGFAVDPQAVADAREAELEDYPLPTFDGLSDIAVPYPENTARLIGDQDLRRTYIDALTDLHLLVEEYRFEALLGYTLLRDYSLKRERGEAPKLKLTDDDILDKLPMPAEALVVLRRYAREPPNAAEVFENPHQQIAGARILSQWVSAQMIDSSSNSSPMPGGTPSGCYQERGATSALLYRQRAG
jgi:hypothetical protein